MQKYSEISLDQRKLVDTHVALTIAHVMGGSADIPSFVGNQAYIEELRNKFSLQLRTLEKARYDTYLKAQEAGIDTNNPQEYINRAVKIVQKLNVLNPNQSARAYQNKKPAAGDKVIHFPRAASY